MIRDLRQVLTPEQLEQFQQMRRQHKGNMSGRGRDHGRGHRHGQHEHFDQDGGDSDQ